MDEALPVLPPRYRCIRHIGDGATGHVYLAKDNELGVDVAFKVVRRNLALHRRFRARFAREVVLLSQVVHRHVCPVHDFGELEDGRPFAALAHANRGNLRDQLRKGLEVSLLLKLLEQVCLALAALHARGIVHQDLKPANLLLHSAVGGRMEAWVADLGVADDISELAKDVRRVGGTPTYMAPEQLQGKPQEVGPWTDLYAVGIMLFEALTGRRPHHGEGRKQLLEARLAAPPKLVPAEGVAVPQPLIDLAENLLDPEPRQRYDRAADVRRALTGIRERLLRTDRVGGFGEDDPTESGDATESAETMPAARSMLDGSARTGVGMGLTWNKVPPEAIPHDPPKDAGLGAPARASLSLFALREIPLIAREGARKMLWQAAREVVVSREPRVVLVVGETGAGKTRLVEGLARSLDEGGWMETVWLRYNFPPSVDDGYRGAVRNLLAPWNDTRLDLQGRLARWLARDRRQPLTMVLHEAGMLARWCGYLLPGEQSPNAALGLSFLYQHMEARSWRGGTCVVLEDVQNSEVEGDGLAIAEALLDRSVGTRATLVLATISAEALQRDKQLQERVEALQELGAVRMGLPRLTLQETRKLLSEALLLEPRLARDLATKIVGWPLRATMLLRDAARRGVLVPGPGMRYELSAGVTIEDLLPSDMEELYLRRIESAVNESEKPEDTRDTLAAVALAGAAPPASIIRHISSPGLEELLATGLLREEGGLLRFEHGSLRNTARRQALAMPGVPVLHDRLAKAWEDLGQRTGMDVDMALGVHRLRAGHPQDAVRPLLRAARTMLDQGRAGPAARAGELAITAADLVGKDGRTGTEHRQEARRLRALAVLAAEQPQAAEQLAAEARSLGDTDELTEARLIAVQAQAMLAMGQADRARRLLEQARQIYTRFQDIEGMAEVAYARGELGRLENQLDAARIAYTQVVNLTAPEHRLSVRANVGLVSLYVLQGNLEKARGLLEDLRWSARASGDTRNVCQAEFANGLVLLAERNHPEAEAAFRTAQAVAATSGDHRMQLNCLNHLGEVARHRGQTDEAADIYERYTRLARIRGFPMLESIGYINAALLDLSSSRYSSADKRARLAAERLVGNNRHWAWLYIGLVRAAAAAGAGEATHARQWWDLARRRGLDQVRSADIELPVHILNREASRRGWRDLAQESQKVLDDIRQAT